MGKMHKKAEWYLYNYQKVKEREAKQRKEIEDDAIYSSYGSGDNTPVKHSVGTSKTESGGIKLATAKARAMRAEDDLWIKAIENVWCAYTHEDQGMAYFMEFCFGLTGKPVNKARSGIVRDEIMARLAIERVQTYYSYRNRIIETVVEEALEIKAYNKKIKAVFL